MTARGDYAAQLESRDFVRLYENGLTKGLDWLDAVFGTGPHFVRGFLICVTLAVAYSFFSFVIGWGIGGTGKIGSLQLLPSIDHWFERVAIALVIVGLSLLCLFIGLKSDKIESWAERTVSHLPFGHRAVAARCYFALAGASVGLAIYVFGIREGVLTPSVPAAVIYVGGFAVAVAGAVAGAGAFAGVGAVAVAFAVLGYGPTDPFTAVIVLFFVLLPLANAVLDHLSLWVSRFLGRRILASRNVWRIVGHTFFDLAAAAIFLIAVAWLIAFLIESFNDAASPPGRPIYDLASVLRQIRTSPGFANRFWIYVMLFSTLLPSLAHFSILGWATFTAFRPTDPKSRVIAILRDPAPTAPDLDKAASHLAAPWAFGAVAGCVAVVCFGGLIVGAVWILWHASTTAALIAVAHNAMGAADALFL